MGLPDGPCHSRACHSPHPAWGQSSRGGGDTGSRKHRSPAAAPPQPPPGPLSPRETRPRLLSFQRLEFLERTPSWVCYFYPPQPSGLHGDASKQQIPGGNDVTFPLPAAQAPRHCCAGPHLTPPGRPRPSPRGRGQSGLSCPLLARRQGLQRPSPSPWRGCAGAPWQRDRPRGGPPSCSGIPAMLAALWELPQALAAGAAGAGRRQALLAAGAAACLAWEAPVAPSSETGDRGRGPRRWRLECWEGLWPGPPSPHCCARGNLAPSCMGVALSKPVVGHTLHTLVPIRQLN